MCDDDDEISTPPLGRSIPFPQRLMTMIRQEARASPEVIRWSEDGLCFFISDEAAFVEEVLPRHNFKATKIQSFQRNLNIYGFKRLTKGPNALAYRHPSFCRDSNDDNKLTFINRFAKVSSSPAPASSRKSSRLPPPLPMMKKQRKRQRQAPQRQAPLRQGVCQLVDFPRHRKAMTTSLQTTLPTTDHGDLDTFDDDFDDDEDQASIRIMYAKRPRTPMPPSATATCHVLALASPSD